jgi:hypothetical protein
MGVVIATLKRPRRGALWPNLPSGGPEMAFDGGIRWRLWSALEPSSNRL